MPLREEIEDAGNWLFRWRSYLPTVVLIIFLLAMLDYAYPSADPQYNFLWEIFCLTVSFFGLTIRVLTIGHTPEGTSGRNTTEQIAESLNTTGIYSVVRNPLYLGNFFMGLGLALFPYLWWLVLIYILIFWLYYERIILAEEAFLREKFGQAYLDWAEKTPVFIPKLDQYTKAALPFSLRNVLKREYNGFLAIVLVMFLLETIGELVIHGSVKYEPWWLCLLGVTVVIWFILRMLKKHTRLFVVEGR